MDAINKKGGNIMSEKTVGEGVKFERIRRITGYLVGTTDRFNNGKRAEERDRVKHSGCNDIKLKEAKHAN